MNKKVEFQCLEQILPEMDDITFSGSFFNSYRYLSTMPFDRIKVFLAKDSKKQVYARFVLTYHDKKWISLSKGPFGGIDCHPTFKIESFLNFIIENIGAATDLVIKNPPNYNENHAEVLRTFGFRTVFNDINHHFDLKKAWAPHLMEQRRIEKCEQAGFIFERLLPTKILIKQVHAFIADCRKDQGLKINIDLSDLERQVDQNPAYYEFYIIKHKEATIAATIVVKINDQVAYNYLPASLKSYNQYSPMTMLLKYLFYTYRSKNYTMLDLGVSSIKGKRQKGLASFKEAMGAITTTKHTMVRGGIG